MRNTDSEPVLSVQNLQVSFKTDDGIVRAASHSASRLDWQMQHQVHSRIGLAIGPVPRVLCGSDRG